MATPLTAVLKLLLAALTAPLLSFSAGAADQPVAQVPFSIGYGGWFTVSVAVNGRGPYDFIIDTGATQSLVFENLARTHDFPLSGGSPRTVLGLAAAGSFPPYRVGEIAIAEGVRLRDHECVVLDDWTVERASPQGVIGLDLLRRFTLVFDAGTKELSFYAAGADAGIPKNWREIKLEPRDFGVASGELYTLNAHLGRAAIPFLLDLGASGTIINHPAVRKYSNQYRTIEYGLYPTRARERIIDALGKTDTVQAYKVRRIKAGDAVWRNAVVYAHPAYIFDDLGVVNQPFGLFGSDMLAGHSFLIDFSGRRMLVGPAPR